MISGIFWGPSEAFLIAFTSLKLGKIDRKPSQIVKHWVLCVPGLWQYSRTIPEPQLPPNQTLILIGSCGEAGCPPGPCNPAWNYRAIPPEEEKDSEKFHVLGLCRWDQVLSQSNFRVMFIFYCQCVDTCWHRSDLLLMNAAQCIIRHVGAERSPASSLHSSFEWSNCPQSPKAPLNVFQTRIVTFKAWSHFRFTNQPWILSGSELQRGIKDSEGAHAEGSRFICI